MSRIDAAGTVLNRPGAVLGARDRVTARREGAAYDDTDVERLLTWAYRDQMADRVGGGHMIGGGVSNAEAMAAYFALGCKIDTPGVGERMAYAGRASAHPVAETVHACVLGVENRGLVIQNARTGSRPDWMPGVVVRCAPVLNGKGRPTMEYADAKRSRPLYCHYQWVPCRPEHLALARGLWCAWWDAVEAVRIGLEDALGRKMVGVREAREPWVEGVECGAPQR